MLIVPLALAACVTPQNAANSPSTRAAGADASPLWQAFLDADGEAKPFVDFSHAGAFYGERALPALKGMQTFAVGDYGAVPDDEGDDTAAIQRAIDAAEAADGGIVRFGRGRYLLNSGENARALTVETSRIVLRGAGQASTELHMARPMPPAEPGKKWTGPAMIRFAAGGGDAPKSARADDRAGAALSGTEVIPIGATRVALSNGSGFAAGDYVLLAMQSPDANAAFTGGRRLRDVWRTIRDRGVGARETHRIKAVDGDTLVLERPLLSALDPALPWRVRQQSMIEQVGVQDLTFSSTWSDPFEHHKDARHDSGYRAIELSNAADSWVSNVTFRNVSAAVSVRGGLANSVLLNTIEGNGGHFSFQVEFATRTLVGMNVDTARGGQWHGPGASHMSVGTVVWRYLSPTSRGIDAHGMFPRHTLIDQVTMRGFGGWGGNTRNLPNHLGGLVIWNFTQTGDHVGNHFKGTLDFWDLPRSDDQGYGFLTAVDPVLAGYRGPVTRFNEGSMVLESPGAQVSPWSLYEAQLERRLGRLPDWIESYQARWSVMQDAGE